MKNTEHLKQELEKVIANIELEYGFEKGELDSAFETIFDTIDNLF